MSALPTGMPHLERKLLSAVNADRARSWTSEDLVGELGEPVIDVLVTLASLAYRGHIERVAPGRYRAASKPHAQHADDLQTGVFGRAPETQAS